MKWLTVLLLFIISVEAQNSTHFYLGAGGGISFEEFNPGDYAITMYRQESADYKFENSYSLKIWGGFKLSEKFSALLSLNYSPGHTGYYGLRDYHNDRLKAHYEMEYLTSYISVKYLLDQHRGFKIYTALGFGWVWRSVNLSKYTTLVNFLPGEIREGEMTKENGLLITPELSLEKSINHFLDIVLAIQYGIIITGMPGEKILILTGGWKINF